MQARFGLIGYPLGHSFSQAYFTDKFHQEGVTASYTNFPLPSLKAVDRLRNMPGLIGLNVTIPYKEQIMPLLDRIDDSARAVGAVNTILCGEGWIGYNTDIEGVRGTLAGWLPSTVTSALILGTGGAARAVRYVLKQLNIHTSMVSRSVGKGNLTYAQLDAGVLAQHVLIVNTTPLGTFPAVDRCPDLPYHFLGPDHYLFDLVYNPEKTLFLKRGEEHGAHIQNGLQMLHIQADRAWEIWKPHLKTGT